jgi:hypothetical protein
MGSVLELLTLPTGGVRSTRFGSGIPVWMADGSELCTHGQMM